MSLRSTLKDVFSLRPPAGSLWGAPQSINEDDLDSQAHFELSAPDDTPQEGPHLTQSFNFIHEKIRFDNGLRAWIASLVLIVSFVLWGGKVISSFLPIVIVFLSYASLQILATKLLSLGRFARQIDFSLCTVDLMALSAAVYLTGGAGSPLYLIYFIPIIIQAFHRDWALILHYGFGGVVTYALAILLAGGHWTSGDFLNLGAHIFFMLLTVTIAAFAVNLLRKGEIIRQNRLKRMKLLTTFSEILNYTNSTKEIPNVIAGIVSRLNLELKESHAAWSRLFLIQNDGRLLQAINDPEHPHLDLKQELPAQGCPAFAEGAPFYLENAEDRKACPAESFSFKSHLCVPIKGGENESFGVIYCGSYKMKAFDYEDVQFFKSLARAMGLMIQRLKRMDELNLAIEMSGCVTANFMGSMRSLEQTYTCVLDGILSILKANQASLMILDKSRGVLVTTMIRGPYPHLDGGVEMPLEEGIPGRVLESCDPALTSELPRHKMGKGKKQPFKSYLCLPLLEIKGQPLGVLNVYSGQHARFFSVHDLNLASTYATRAALALENVLLHQRHSDSSKEATPEKGEKKAA